MLPLIIHLCVSASTNAYTINIILYLFSKKKKNNFNYIYCKYNNNNYNNLSITKQSRTKHNQKIYSYFFSLFRSFFFS